MTSAVVLGAGLAVAPHLAAIRAAGVDRTLVVTADPGRAARVRELDDRALVVDRIGAAFDVLGGDPAFGVIATPPAAHLDGVVAFAGRGLDAVCEKPFGIDLRAATGARAASAAAGTRLAVSLQHRYKPAATAAREILASGAIGAVVAAQIRVPWWRPQSYYDEPGRGSLRRDGGGVLITQAIHVLDLYLWLCPGVTRVSALGGTTAAHRMETEDVIQLLVEHPGHTATMLATTAAPPGGEEQIVLYGTHGRLELTGAALDAWDADGHRIAEVLATTSGRDSDPAAMTEWFEALYRDVLDAWAAGTASRVDAASVMETWRVMAGAYRSMAASGEWMEVTDVR